MAEEGKVSSVTTPSPGGVGKRGGRNNRHRRNTHKNNRNKTNNSSQSPARKGNNGNPNAGNSNNNNSNSNNQGQNKNTPSKSTSPTRQRSNNKSKSRSPVRRNNKSKSPSRPNGGGKKQSPDMAVIVNRCDLWDSAAHFQPDENQQCQQHPPHIHAGPYNYVPNAPQSPPGVDVHSVGVARVPRNFQKFDLPVTTTTSFRSDCDVLDTSIPNPHDPNVVHDKYWAQRRRLFSKFDQGIRLDSEGWYSVTPEIIADHVAQRVAELANTIVASKGQKQGIILMDAFCGCGGNSIAFGKIASSSIAKVICIDTDRTKLLKAAHNASLYGIPKEKLVFVECNSTFILKYCYKDGDFVLDRPTTTLPAYMPKPVMSTTSAGYKIGGLDMLPRKIDAVFMDPPWGGIDYEVLGKHGYDLKKNMLIRVSPEEEEEEDDDDGFSDDFFDTFSNNNNTPKKKMSQKDRKANFNKKTEGEFINGMELLKVAAEATSSRIVVYDLPRNTNKMTLGKYASDAGYRGNMKLEEHFLNGRLKTVTAYMGADYSSLINDYSVSSNNDHEE